MRRVVPRRQRFLQGVELDGITQRRTGSVGFDVRDLTRRDPGILQRLSDHGLLCRTIGRGEAVAASVLVDGGSADDRQDPVPVCHGVGQPLQDHHAAPFSADISVGAGIERLAPAGAGQHARLRQRDAQPGGQDQIDAPGERNAALAAAQALAGEVDGDE